MFTEDTPKDFLKKLTCPNGHFVFLWDEKTWNEHFKGRDKIPLKEVYDASDLEIEKLATKFVANKILESDDNLELVAALSGTNKEDVERVMGYLKED